MKNPLPKSMPHVLPYKPRTCPVSSHTINNSMCTSSVENKRFLKLFRTLSSIFAILWLERPSAPVLIGTPSLQINWGAQTFHTILAQMQLSSSVRELLQQFTNFFHQFLNWGLGSRTCLESASICNSTHPYAKCVHWSAPVCRIVWILNYLHIS